VEASNACYMGWLPYTALMEKAAVTDEGSTTCQTRDLDIIFKASNFEVKGSDPKDDNPLESLTRQEWLEVVMRVAKAKFGGGGKGAAKSQVPLLTVAESVDALVAHMFGHLKREALSNEFEAEAVDLRDQWRLTEFYTLEVDLVYRRWRPRLESLYGEKVDAKNVGTHNLWTLQHWNEVLTEALFLEDESFTFEEANLCFYFSKFTVHDYVKDSVRNESLDWLSFLEALGHVARFKELPRHQDLVHHGFKQGTCVELADGLRLENVSWNEWMATHPPVGDNAGEPAFHVRLESLLSLLFHMLGVAASDKKAAAASEAKGPSSKKSRGSVA